jgi:hypothetical protein
VGEQDRREDAERMAGWHSASATGPAQPREPTRRQARRRSRVSVLAGGLLVTAVSVIFIASFIGALHNPGPRSAVQNTVYFSVNAITTKLLTLSAWALGGAILLVMAGVLHWPMPGERSHASGRAAGSQPRHAVTAERARPGS